MRATMEAGGAARHLLLVEGDAGRRKSLGFVLGLSGYRVTPVRTPFEALDWAVKRQGTAEPFSAVVVGSLAPPHGPQWLMDRLARAVAAIPVVLVDEGKPAAAEQGGMVIVCRPEEVAAMLETLQER